MKNNETYQVLISKEIAEQLSAWASNSKRRGDEAFAEGRMTLTRSLRVFLAEALKAAPSTEGMVLAIPDPKDRRSLPGGGYSWTGSSFIGLFFPRGDKSFLPLVGEAIHVRSESGHFLLIALRGRNADGVFKDLESRLRVTQVVAV